MKIYQKVRKETDVNCEALVRGNADEALLSEEHPNKKHSLAKHYEMAWTKQNCM